MARIHLRGPLKQRAGDRADHDIDATTVHELLAALERAQPGVEGWILDERGRLRRHINVFVNGEQADPGTPVAAADRVEILPAISGGET